MSGIKPPLRLVADDLSGALDTLVQFRLPGMAWPALAVWHRRADDAAALSTGTRDVSEKTARACIAEVAPWLTAAALAYKKIDSRMRGPVAAEIAALVAHEPARRVVVAPTLPTQGRILRAGRVTTQGMAERVDLSADLARLGLGCALAGPGDTLPTGVSLWHAATDADLDRIAATALTAEAPVTFCGSAGLAAALARAVGGHPAVRVPIAGPVLILIGTDHPVARRQVSQIAALGAHRVISIGPDGRGVSDVAARMAYGDSCAVTVALPPDTDRATAAVTIRQRFAALLAQLPRPGTLFASGGATLQAVAEALGAEGIRVRGEQDAGIPAGTLSGGRWDGLAVLSKSGGFGGPESLVTILDDAR